MHPCATPLPSPAEHGGGCLSSQAQVSNIVVWRHHGGNAAHPPLTLPHPPPQHTKQVLLELFDYFSLSLLETRQQQVP